MFISISFYFVQFVFVVFFFFSLTVLAFALMWSRARSTHRLIYECCTQFIYLFILYIFFVRYKSRTFLSWFSLFLSVVDCWQLFHVISSFLYALAIHQLIDWMFFFLHDGQRTSFLSYVCYYYYYSISSFSTSLFLHHSFLLLFHCLPKNHHLVWGIFQVLFAVSKTFNHIRIRAIELYWG